MTYTDLDQKTQDTYSDLDPASKEALLEYDSQGTLRFLRNKAVRWLCDRYNSGFMNDMWIAAQREDWPIEDLMDFYRQLGYSLCGYVEVFGEHLAEMEETRERNKKILERLLQEIENEDVTG